MKKLLLAFGLFGSFAQNCTAAALPAQNTAADQTSYVLSADEREILTIEMKRCWSALNKLTVIIKVDKTGFTTFLEKCPSSQDQITCTQLETRAFAIKKVLDSTSLTAEDWVFVQSQIKSLAT